MKGIVKRTVSAIVLIWAACLVLFCIVAPRFQKKAEPSGPAQTASGERVHCIDDNQEALIRRLQVIESAEKELILSTYYYGDDESARDVSAALVHAAERGVDVRVLVDGLSAFTILNRSETFRTLAHTPNIEIRVYNPVHVLWPWSVNYRMHDKYLAADDQVYILGGRNTRNVSLGNYAENRDMDRDMLVYTQSADPGASIRQVQAYFEEIWDLDTNRPYTRSTKKAETVRQGLRDHYEALQTRYPEAFASVDWEQETVAANSVTLLHNPIHAGTKAPTLWADLVAAMSRGQEVIIQTPYLICNHTMYENLRDLHRNNIGVKVITNAPECGANPSGCADYLNQRHKIRATGMEVYEYAGPHSAHSKTILVDDSISIVGSFNCDMRSAYLDTEMMLLIDCPELNAHLRQLDEGYMASSRCIRADGTKILGEDFVKPHMSVPKYLLYGVLRLVTLPVRHLL